MRDYVHSLDRFVEGVRGNNVLDNCVLELRLVLGEHGDPFLGFGSRAASPADAVSFVEEGECDSGAHEADE